MKTEINKASLAAGVLMLGLLALATGSRAYAEDIVCASLDGLNQTMPYLWFANNKDQLSLQGKLDEAQVKLDEFKVCDAGQKISDFNIKLMRLATASKSKVEETAPGALLCALEGSKVLAAEWLTGCEPVGDPPRGKGPRNQ